MNRIEKNIPVPVSSQRGRPAKYPFMNMDVGDSVFFEGEKSGGLPYVAAKNHEMRSLKKFSGRTCVNDDGVSGLRIWRIA